VRVERRPARGSCCSPTASSTWPSSSPRASTS
jgi:hypothetical protein